MSEANSRDVAAWTDATKDGVLRTGERRDDQADRERKRALWQTAAERFATILEAEKDQRRQELEDLQFDRGRVEDHWPADMIEARKATTIDGIQVAARPCLVINKLTVPVTQVENEMRQARLEPVVKPKPGKTNEKDAEVAQGILRAIGIQSNAQAAREWAGSRAVRCGRGYYRVDIGYANDGDFEMDILVLLIRNQGSVYLDPYHTQPDASDATYGFQTEDVPFEEAKRRYPELTAILAAFRDGHDQWTSLTDKEKTWVNGTKGTVRLAEYFYVEETERWLVEGYDRPFDTEPDTETIEGLGPYVVGAVEQMRRVRKVGQKRVKWALLGPSTVLAESDWPGRYIPFVQVIGRMINVDGQTSYKGVITDAKDAQRVYNYGVSTAVETVAILPRAPWVAAYGQIEKFKRIWQLANQRSFSHLPYEPVSVGGSLAPAPQRTNIQADLSGAASLIAQADNDIKATTGRWDASLGNMNPQERSGKALRELKLQGEIGSSHFTGNMAMAVRHEATIELDLLKPIYREPGRIARMLGNDGVKEREVMLNAPFVRDEQGRPQPAPTGAQAVFANLKAKMLRKPLPQVEQYNLAEMDFSGVVVDVAPSARTQRDENISFLQSLIDADPNMAPLLADIMAEEMGGTLARKVAARIRAVNPQLKGDEENPLPPEAQAEIAQRDQQIQQLTQALQQAQMAVATNQAKQQAQVQVATIKEQGAAQRIMAQFQANAALERAKLEAKMQELRAQIDGEERLAEFDAAMQKALQDDEQRHEIEMARLTAVITRQQQEREAHRADLAEARTADREDWRAERDHSRETAREREAREAEMSEAERNRAFERDARDADRTFEAESAEASRQHESKEAAAARKAATNKPPTKK